MWLWPSEHFLSFSGIMLEEKQMIEVFQKSLFEQLLVSIWEIDGCKRRLNYGNVLSLLICWVWLYNIKTVSSRSLWFPWVIHGFSMLHSLSVSLLFPSLTQPHSPSSSSLPLTVSLNPTSKLYVMWCISCPFFPVLSLFHFLCQCWSPPPHASSFLSLLLVSLYLSMESTQFCNNRSHFVVAVFSLHLWSHILFPAFHFWKIIKRRSHKVKGGSALSWASRGKVLVTLKRVHTVCSVFLRGQRLPCWCVTRTGCFAYWNSLLLI